ncbi:UbiH/UbiF/VisC/COQ6 family ubiquinone biosynthesis hydroxylase [Imbroritus primus]|uniref:UbiH/UbiF/VisC/COQ6 family ubiquinone biosynthesis hydroxylase n=1 Tax=Imbroritus primus TaxID=3058603 RepID=A0ACD3SJV3_9BURK|nr:UbiH/UbiF/VisC/COQ6 family ubiquinone biosynthesis hydroxylase [Burkholderiaceae bacterium PBA]
MATDTFDIAIVGAGPVGLTAALWLLRTTQWRIALYDARDPELAHADPRTIALSHGSATLLQSVGAWPLHATGIEHIHVSQRGFFGQTTLHVADYGVPALGHVARYGAVSHRLHQALDAYAGDPRLTLIPRTVITALEQADDHVVIRTAEGTATGTVATATLAIQAEGGLYHEQAGKSRQHDYQQTAIVSHVTCEAPRPGWAWERFTTEGPLALLPQDDGFALVWCCTAAHAAERMAMTDAEFLAALGEAFGQRMGHFLTTTRRHHFPLGLNAASELVQGRIAAIGNAAQTLHPVAGQGLNLGLRDAFVLASSLRDSLDPAALRHFARQRAVDRRLTIGATDLLPRLFAIPSGLAGHARGAALALFDLLPPLKRSVARHMMIGQR